MKQLLYTCRSSKALANRLVSCSAPSRFLAHILATLCLTATPFLVGCSTLSPGSDGYAGSKEYHPLFPRSMIQIPESGIMRAKHW